MQKPLWTLRQSWKGFLAKEQHDELSYQKAFEQGRVEGLAEGTKLVDMQKELHAQLKKKMHIMENLHKRELESAKAEALCFQNEAKDNGVQGQAIADQLMEAEWEIELVCYISYIAISSSFLWRVSP